MLGYESSTRIALAFAILLCAGRAARADGPLPDVAVRAGFAAQAHTGAAPFGAAAPFAGTGADLGLEAGMRVTHALTIRAGLEWGPRIVRSIPGGSDGDVELFDRAIFGVVEYRLDPYFLGVGGGWVQESTTSELWMNDGLGPVGPFPFPDVRSGPLVLARAGMQLGLADRISVNLVLQLTAQRIMGPDQYGDAARAEYGYGASLGLEIRGVADRSPSGAPHRRTRSLFVGAELGLTGTLNGSTEGFSAWDNAAPLAGLEVGGYVIPSLAIVLGAAGAPDLPAGHYNDAETLRIDNNQARFTLGAEAHHHTLFASAGGGVSRFTQKGTRAYGSYQYNDTSYSKLLYLGAGVELPRGIVRYRVGGEVETFDVAGDPSNQTVWAFTLTFGVRLSTVAQARRTQQP